MGETMKWRAVPEEPTEEMIAAGWIDKEDVNPDEIYTAMLAAAPPAPPPATELVEALEEIAASKTDKAGNVVPKHGGYGAQRVARAALAKFKEQSHG